MKAPAPTDSPETLAALATVPAIAPDALREARETAATAIADTFIMRRHRPATIDHVLAARDDLRAALRAVATFAELALDEIENQRPGGGLTDAGRTRGDWLGIRITEAADEEIPTEETIRDDFAEARHAAE